MKELEFLLKLTKEESNKIFSDKEGLIKELKNTNKTVNNLQNQIKEKDNKINNLIENVGEVTTYKNKLTNFEQEMKNKEKENINLRQQNENLLKNSSTKKEFIGLDDLKDFYDVVIEIDSINTLIKTGWRINYNEKRKEFYQKVIKEETIKVGVLGLNNVGKTFILGLLSGWKDIPSGWSIETKGISIRYTDGIENCEKGVCLLDSAGIETPLLDDDIKDEEEKKNDENDGKNEIDNNLMMMDKYQEIAKDKGQTERFIEELIISLSDMLILVVGKLTRREQNFISRIKDIVNEKENNQFKSIIVIHNLAQYNELIEVDKHINQILKKSATFKLQKKMLEALKIKKIKYFILKKIEPFIISWQDKILMQGENIMN